jgi:DNA topoisomerase-1
MHEYEEGKLKSGSGRKVKSRKQAIAIAISESGQSKRHKKASLVPDVSARRKETEVPDVAAGLDPQTTAKQARLHYTTDGNAGITRHKARRGFDYRRPAGSVVRELQTLQRIKSLVIPPAWSAVWISSDPLGHLQVTGRDQRGRKQYRYHPRWRVIRDEAKYGKTLMFARVLPSILARVGADLRLHGLPRERVLAAVVRLLELSLFRIGNSEYAKTNGSFGLTTLRDRHARIEGSHIHLSFRGKGGSRNETDINDPRLARVVKACRDLPGYELFQYVDDAGERHTVTSTDVNVYLHEISGEEITAKDFRTWAGTNLAALALREFEHIDNDATRKRAIVRAVERVAKHLGNTPAVCRRCYIHPEIFEGFLDGTLLATLAEKTGAYLIEEIEGMSAEEAAVAAFLRLRLGELAEQAA